MLPRVKYNLNKAISSLTNDEKWIEGDLLGFVTKPQSVINYGVGGINQVVSTLNTNPGSITYALIGQDDGSIVEVNYIYCRYVKPEKYEPYKHEKEVYVKALSMLESQPTISRRGGLIMLDFDSNIDDAELAFGQLEQIFGS